MRLKYKSALTKTRVKTQRENLEIKLFLCIGIPLIVILLIITMKIDVTSIEGM
jgi:hypothetical protein